jgi:hypothetical protein
MLLLFCTVQGLDWDPLQLGSNRLRPLRRPLHRRMQRRPDRPTHAVRGDRFCGGGEPGPDDGNPFETAQFGQVTCIAFVPSTVAGTAAGGTLYVCDATNKRLAVVS